MEQIHCTPVQCSYVFRNRLAGEMLIVAGTGTVSRNLLLWESEWNNTIIDPAPSLSLSPVQYHVLLILSKYRGYLLLDLNLQLLTVLGGPETINAGGSRASCRSLRSLE